MDRAVILGASRGLGAQLVAQASATRYSVTGFGRKESNLRALQERFPLFEYQVADFSTRVGQDLAISYLLETSFNHVFCVAGGGPYGRFGEQSWESHDWAIEVSFRFQARLLHALAQNHRFEQVVLIGSSVAETLPDPKASSYCAAKHALRGLWSTIRLEYPEWDVRLFSPGYMDTDMLPANAAVRKLGVYDPATLARELWMWSLTADKGGHKVYPKHPA